MVSNQVANRTSNQTNIGPPSIAVAIAIGMRTMETPRPPCITVAREDGARSSSFGVEGRETMSNGRAIVNTARRVLPAD